MSEVRHLNPSKYMVVIAGASVPGVKSIAISRPNDAGNVECDLEGVPTFIENPQAGIFEVTLTLGSEASGNILLNVPTIAKTLVPFAVINSEEQSFFVATEKARIMYTGSGVDDTGSDTPVNWKIIGVSSKMIF